MSAPARWAAIGCALSLTACGPDLAPAGPRRSDGPPEVGVELPPFTARCTDDAATIVEQSYLAALGRRPESEAEQRVAVDIVTGAADGTDARRALLPLLRSREGFAERWSDVVLDHLRVPRTTDRERPSMAGCYGERARSTDDPALARHVGAHAGRELGAAPGGAFTMLDLVRSSIAADDLSPIFLGHVLAMLEHPVWPANAVGEERERLRRDDFGRWLDQSVLGRDLTCVRCHNGEGGVTWSEDELANRHWPLPGHLERAVWGSSTEIDPDAAHAALRYEGFVSGSIRPWGWASECGSFAEEPRTDVARAEAHLGSIRGTEASGWDVEAALRRGFAILRAHGLEQDEDGTATDPDAALAYLAAAGFVDAVFAEVVGARLTIAHHVARTREQRDLHVALTDRFVRSGYSLRRLLEDVVSSGYFALGECEDALPPVIDPWVDPGPDGRRHDGRDDAVVPLPPRTMLRATWSALGWPVPSDRAFPGPEEAALQRAIGVFLRHSEPGFRGLDAQALFAWERTVGACEPRGEGADAITEIARRAESERWTARRTIAAIETRLLGHPEALSADGAIARELLGVDADEIVPGDGRVEPAARRVCGAILTSPRFLLGGTITPEVAGAPPPIEPPIEPPIGPGGPGDPLGR